MAETNGHNGKPAATPPEGNGNGAGNGLAGGLATATATASGTGGTIEADSSGYGGTGGTLAGSTNDVDRK